MLRCYALPLMLMVSAAHAQTYVLDSGASPVRVEFNAQTARLVVTNKATSRVWKNPDSGGGDTITVSNVVQPTGLRLTADASTSFGLQLSLAITLDEASGDLRVTLGGNPDQSMSRVLRYPYAFYPADGSGYAVVPVFGGYVVPTESTTWSLPSGHSRMEWFGGTDSAWNEGWICIADPAGDMFLSKQTGTITGVGSRLGMAFEWRATNGAPSGGTSKFGYDRTATYRFFSSGGYVAQAKRFREFAQSKGWVRTLADKAAANPEVAGLIGAPVIYLWGDGRSTTMLDALEAAGLRKGLIQISINHVDQNNAFPNQAFADGRGWADAVRAKGWIPGIYDLYVRYNAPQTQPPYNGFVYLWPSSANPSWIYVNSDGSLSALDICAQRAGPFARDTRLPAHISRFGLDAFFFDVTCAVEPREDYGTSSGHTASRTQDIGYRAALLGAASVDLNKIAGAEQAKSWAVPKLHWAEGMYKLGAVGTAQGYGSFNNNVYPQVLTDVTDPGSNLSGLLSTGFQAPLWDLVYHDCMLSTQHWHLAHNKLLYCWDQADLAAIVRGQAPILHLSYNAAQGTVGRAIAGATDVRDGKFWDTRWTNANVRERATRTFQTVCDWHGRVGLLPMHDHRFLAADQSVQLSEFSGNGGVSGEGVVVNFGVFDGQHGVTGPAWTGTVRGSTLTVPVGEYRTYSWNSCPADFNGDGFLDGFDYDDFVGCFEGSPATPTPCPPGKTADFNGDGFADGFDYDDFVGAFEAGC